METVELVTADEVTLVGDVIEPDGADRAVLLLHMLPADRTSWRPFASRLAQRGIASLAIDLRGHGKSRRQAGGRRLDYHLFQDWDHQASRNDVATGLAYLRQRWQPISATRRLGVVGASIGANLALWALAHQPDLAWAVCLSPGLNYHGLTTADCLASLQAHQAVYLAASQDDPTSLQAVRQLTNQATAADRTTQELTGAGHGTTMWERQPALMDAILDWIDQR